jgi:hypothetical protein
VFELSDQCDLYRVNGTYIKGKSLDNSNYLTVAVNVTKVGMYTISVDAIFNSGGTLNGYGFTGSGTFLNLGLQTINLQAQGKPINIHSDPNDATVGDGLKIIAQGTLRTAPTCVVVPVFDDIAIYSLNCSSTTISGKYLKGTALLLSNYIDINVNVSQAGSYSITTPVTSGIKFSASGNFTVGTHTVRLIGEGKPTVNLDFPITINSNTSEGNATCTTTVPMTLPDMTYAVIGADNIYSWNSPDRRRAFGTLSPSFGQNGALRMQSFTLLWNAGTSVTNATTLLNSGSGTAHRQPDVVLYFAYGAATTPELASALANYINKGGCVIFGSTDADVATVINNIKNMISGVFGDAIAAGVHRQVNDGEDDVYPIAMLPTDPVINGPFGNLSGKYWGEDNTSQNSVVLDVLPPNSVQVCSAASTKKSALATPVSPETSIVWYNESKNFFFFGDCTGTSINSTDPNGYPTLYTDGTTGGVPRSKTYGASAAYRQVIFNSALELNAVAWAVKKAAVSGINPH